MQERNGVRKGQRVRDLDGKPLGRVTVLYEWGFAVHRGLPFLVRSDYLVRYDEVRGVRDGALVVARSSRDLFDLAAGDIPPSWRVPAPPEFPSAATPSEARFLREDLARRALGAQGAPAAASAPDASPAPLDAEEEREYVRSRGQSLPAPPAR
jgi:hypothetical protein